MIRYRLVNPVDYVRLVRTLPNDMANVPLIVPYEAACESRARLATQADRRC